MKERLAYFQQYVDHHVMHHEGTPDASTFSEWISNLGFPKLAIFHNDVVMLLVVVLVLCLIAFLARRKIGKVPSGFGLLMEKYVIFIRDEMVEPNFGGKGSGPTGPDRSGLMSLFTPPADCGLPAASAAPDGNRSGLRGG